MRLGAKIMAGFKMNKAAVESTQLAREYVPEVEAASKWKARLEETKR